MKKNDLRKRKSDLPAQSTPSAGFRVEFAVHLRYAKGSTTFSREVLLPFAPFPNLTVLDDVLGEFTLKHVAWCSKPDMFLCQATVNRDYWSLRDAVRSMKAVGWKEERDCREPDAPIGKA
jgi:hypothetical protein